jgi:D-alanyl-D-alanine dipeptidase
MNFSDKIERSKSKEKIDFTKINCLDQKDPLVKVEPSEKIIVEPIWAVAGDLEGGMYADYIAAHPEYDGVYVRSQLLKHLEKAANSLTESYKLIVRAGHRPYEVQKRLLKDVMQDYKNENPFATDEEALKHARMYVSDPDIKLPPHCCGAAVDVDMFDTSIGRPVDFGSPVNEDSDISHLYSEKVTPKQKENRLLLLTTMLNADFSSYYAEWWHYSYGSEQWAWFYHKDSCLYGLIEP